MNEVHDVQPGHIYQPGNKKEVRLVYRILSGPYCGRHQKSFSLTKWGVAGAWDAAQQAKAYMLQTGRLPPSFASPYSRSKLTNASANAIVLSKPLQAPRPLLHPGALPGGHGRADAASLLASAASGGHLNLDPAIAAAASRFLPLETFSAVAALARSRPPHHTHEEKDGPASGLAFSAFSDNLPAPFPSFLPPPTFPARPAAAGSPAGGWSYLSSVHATLAAAAAAQRASGAGAVGHVGGHENADEHRGTGHDSGPYSLEQEDSSSSGCIASAAETRIRANATTADPAPDAGEGGPPVMSSYQGSLATHPSELIGLHMLPGTARPPPPYTATAAAEGIGSAAVPPSNGTPPNATDSRAGSATTGPVNPAAAAATAFTLLQLAEQNAMLPQAKDQQQLNHNALQHFMLLHQLQMMQEKQQKEAQQHQEEHERLCSLKLPPVRGYQPTREGTEGGRVKGAETADEGEEADDTTELEKQDEAACAASASSAESDLTRATSVERWQNETCSSAEVGDGPHTSPDAAQLGGGSITCPAAPEALSQSGRSVCAAHDAFAGLPDPRQHEHQHHPTQHQEPQEPHRQTPHQHNGQVFPEERNYEATLGMRETLRNLLIAASLQQQRLHQQHLAVAEHFHSHHPHVPTLAMKGLGLGRPTAAPPPPPGLLNISALASLLPGGMLSHKQQTAADSMMTHSSSPSHRGDNSVGAGGFVQAGAEKQGAAHSSLEEEKPANSLLSGGFHANKDAGFPSQLSLLWGVPQVDHLADKNKHTATTAGAGGHCDSTGATPICSLEMGPPLRSAATLGGENFTLLNDSAATAVVARLKGLPECAGAVLHHTAASSSEGVGNVEGECEAMSSCRPGGRDECEKTGVEPFQLARINESRRQYSLLQNLSPPPLQILPANNGAASPLRLARAADSNGNICCVSGGSRVDDEFAVAGAVVTPSSARCHVLMHSEFQHGAHLSSMAVREGVSATLEQSAACGSNPTALRTCGSPNNTPSRTSGGTLQPYCGAGAAVDACTHLSPVGGTRNGGLCPTGDGRLHSHTTGRSACVTSLVNNILQVSSPMITEASVPAGRIGDVDLSEALLTDASPGEGVCDPPFITEEGKITDDSNRTTAIAGEGDGRSDIFGELAREASSVTRNDSSVEEDKHSNGTRGANVLETIDRCDSSSTSGSIRSELRRRRDTAVTVGTSAPPSAGDSVSCIKRARVDLRGHDAVSEMPSSDSQDEKEELMRTRSRTTDGKKQIVALSDAASIRGLGKHHTRRRLYF